MSASDGALQAEVERLRELNADLVAYRDIGERLLGAVSMEQAAAALETVVDLFGAEGGALLVASDGRQPAQERWEYNVRGDAWEGVLEATRRGLLSAIERDQEPLAEDDAAAFFAREGLPATPQVGSLLAMPVCTEECCLGVVVLYNLSRPERSAEYARQAAPLMSLVGQAIARVRLAEASARDARLLETIVENTGAHLVYLDAEMRFVRANSAYLKGCGHTWEELAGRNHFDLFPNSENQAIFERVRDTGEPVEFREKPFEFVDQPERGVTYWDWTLTPMRDEAGAVQGLVLSLTDVTEQVRTRDRMLAAERERVRLAETLAAEVSHRVKNDLALVVGLLQTQLDSRPHGEHAAVMVREAISRICTIAAVQDQLSGEQMAEVELCAVLRRIAEINCETLSGGKVETEVRGEPLFYPARIATAVGVVANELVTNAIKYGAPGADGRVWIRISIALREGRLQLSVWNSGNPVPPDVDLVGQGTMGWRLVHDMTVGHYQGSFTVRPHDGGTMAEVVVDDARLRRER
jgi:PAS domain S-box-containing protein